jgi:hypothetical protein
MDFIERLFGISPDGGNGVLEAVYFAAIFALVCAIFWRRIAAWRRNHARE